MSRMEEQLQSVDPTFAQALSRVPQLHTPPLPADWLRCEMLERYQVLQHGPSWGGRRVLEVGCGGHALSTVPLAALAGKDGQVVAVELRRWGVFQKVIRQVRLWDTVCPVRADARHLPFVSNSFDLATAVHGIRSLRSEVIMVQVLREMLRVAPRVFLAESLPIARTDAQRAHLDMYNLRQAYFEASTGRRDDLHYLPQERLHALISEAGGEVISSQVVPIDLPHYLAYFPRELLLNVKDASTRADLLARWDRAERHRTEHGTDHPPVAAILAGRRGGDGRALDETAVSDGASSRDGKSHGGGALLAGR